MDKIIVEGGLPLSGSVEVSGAKNAALPVVAASLLSEGDHLVLNVPDLADVRTLSRLLRHMGCTVERVPGPDRAVAVRVPKTISPEAPYELVKTMRASCWCSGRSSPATAGAGSPCPADAPSAQGPSTST